MNIDLCRIIFSFLKSSVLDFGKIIIYTSNLRIIRAPQRKTEALRCHTVPHVDLEKYPKARERGSRRRAEAPSIQNTEETEEEQITDTETKVMVLSQIIISGVIGFLSPCFCLTSSFSFYSHMSSAILHFIFTFKIIVARSPMQPCYSNLKLLKEGCSSSPVNLLCDSL